MSVLQVLYSLWQSERTQEERAHIARLLPDQEKQREALELVERAEKQAFSIGFKTALELVRELESIRG